jgi:hypothetical protein
MRNYEVCFWVRRFEALTKICFLLDFSDAALTPLLSVLEVSSGRGECGRAMAAEAFADQDGAGMGRRINDQHADADEGTRRSGRGSSTSGGSDGGDSSSSGLAPSTTATTLGSTRGGSRRCRG